MAQIVDIEYYKNTYLGNMSNFTDQEIMTNLKRAEDSLHAITLYKLRNGQVEFGNLLSFQQEMIRDAICTIAEGYILSGGYEHVESGMSTDGIVTATVGGFSYTKETDSRRNGSSGQNTMVIPRKAMEMLSQTGLLYTGVDVRCE